MRSRDYTHKEIDAVLGELKGRLERLYRDRLVSVILYGSYARGEAREGPDIDVVKKKMLFEKWVDALPLP
ncbi:MAG: nucleotidyltransferase domain-containing protein [Deltaproteobacteria bacterium]|nr:nucleotidyltransferase domain-containing protein [Deltaproteobacteria bacterium]